MTTRGGTGLWIAGRSLTTNHPTPCQYCKAAVVIDQGRAEAAHVVGALCDTRALVHEGRAA